jgi:hypothetical protein
MSEEREKSDKREDYVRVRGRLWVARGRWQVSKLVTVVVEKN